MAQKIISMIHKICLFLSAACFLGLIGSWIAKNFPLCGLLAVLSIIFFAIGISCVPKLRGYRFTVCVIAAVVAPMIYPQYVLRPAGINLQENKRLFLFIVQLVMFGMGTQMGVKDFIGVVKMPKAVFIGIACQFTIMPLVGYTLAHLLGFSDEVGGGIILIGSCSSGLASNVMTHKAGGNLALSVTLTALAQLIAPIITPLWIMALTDLVGDEGKLKIGELILEFLGLMITITKLVVLPILAAFLYNWLRKDRLKGLHSFMPILSMAGIIYFTAMTTAEGRDNLLKVGELLVIAAILHNTLGYILGYYSCRMFGLDKNSCRTIAIEVGMQNGAMASGLAKDLNKLATAGLAPAIFSPWMNVSGSILANYWRKHK